MPTEQLDHDPAVNAILLDLRAKLRTATAARLYGRVYLEVGYQNGTPNYQELDYRERKTLAKRGGKG